MFTALRFFTLYGVRAREMGEQSFAPGPLRARSSCPALGPGRPRATDVAGRMSHVFNAAARNVQDAGRVIGLEWRLLIK